MEDLFVEIALIVGIAAVAGGVASLLRQPLLVAFIAVGVLVGPAGLGYVAAGGPIELLARIGIAILLFLVGLRLDLQVIRSMGPVALATGLGQVAFTSIVGLGLCLALGYGFVESIYVAVALTFSSTIIIVKLLSDKREIDALHGRIAVGFLIVQDMAAIVAMIALSAANAGGESSPLGHAALVLMRGAISLAALTAVTLFVLPRVIRWIAKSPELLLLAAVAWAVALAAGAEWIGFSKEVGAFLAGVSLASTPYRDAIGSRLVSLRDFLLLFFFVELGAGLNLAQAGDQIIPTLVLSAFVLIGNPLIVLAIMGFMGYRRRTSFLAGLTVAQVSEFSLILGAMGVALGHLNAGAMGLITWVAIITIGLSTYLILYSHLIYDRLSPWLKIFERKIPYREIQEDTVPFGIETIVFGLGRYGSNLASRLRERGTRLLGVDFDPYVVAQWRKRDWEAQYGDAEDPEFAASLPLRGVRWVICTAPRPETNRALLSSLREFGYEGRIALTAHHAFEANALEALNPDLVLLPFADAAKEAADRLLAEPPEDSSAAAVRQRVGDSPNV